MKVCLVYCALQLRIMKFCQPTLYSSVRVLKEKGAAWVYLLYCDSPEEKFESDTEFCSRQNLGSRSNDYMYVYVYYTCYASGILFNPKNMKSQIQGGIYSVKCKKNTPAAIITHFLRSDRNTFGSSGVESCKSSLYPQVKKTLHCSVQFILFTLYKLKFLGYNIDKTCLHPVLCH